MALTWFAGQLARGQEVQSARSFAGSIVLASGRERLDAAELD